MYYDSVESRLPQFFAYLPAYTAAFFAIQIERSRKTHELIFSFNLNATNVKNWLIGLQVLWFLNSSSCLKNNVCLFVIKLHDLNGQAQRKPELTVHLSTLTFLLWYVTVMQTLLLCIQTIFVLWVTLQCKSTAQWSCCNAKQCFCSFAIRSN